MSNKSRVSIAVVSLLILGGAYADSHLVVAAPENLRFVDRICINCGADLIIERIAPTEPAFCVRDEQGLIFRVKNNGELIGSGQSFAVVTFSWSGGAQSRVAVTPPLAAKQTVDLRAEIPSACWDPDCNFSISADVNDDVNETNESNNTVSSHCIG